MKAWLLELLFVLTLAVCPLSFAQTSARAQGDVNTLVRVLVSKGILTPEDAASIDGGAAEKSVEKLLKLLVERGVISQDEDERILGHPRVEDPGFSASGLVASAVPVLPPTAANAEQRVVTPGGPPAAQAPAPAPEAQLPPPIAPLRVFPITIPKKEGLIPDMKLGAGALLRLYGFFKASAVEQTASNGGRIFGSNDFPVGPLFIGGDTGPDGDPQVHIKNRQLRLGVDFEWPDPSRNVTVTGKLEFDFEGNFTDVNNRNISSNRSSQPSLRLAWVRLDTKAGKLPVFVQFGQDWSIFGSSTLMDLFETTGFGFAQGNLYERMPMFRTGVQFGSANFKIQPEFAIALPSFGEPGLDTDERLRFGGRVGPESNQPEIQSRIVFQFPVSRAPGVLPAQFIFSHDHAQRAEIIDGSSLTGILHNAFPDGLKLTSNRNAWSAEFQLPTSYATLVGKYYRGGDLRYYFMGQFNDVFANLGGAPSIGTATSYAGRTIPSRCAAARLCRRRSNRLWDREPSCSWGYHCRASSRLVPKAARPAGAPISPTASTPHSRKMRPAPTGCAGQTTGEPARNAMVRVTEQAIDQYGNVNWTKQEKADGTVLRTTSYSYLHESSPNSATYLSRYIRNRLTRVQVTQTANPQDTTTWVPFRACYDDERAPCNGGLQSTLLIINDATGPIQLHDTTNYGTGEKLRGNAVWVVKGGSTTSTSQIDVTGMVRTNLGPNGTATIDRSSNLNQYGMVPGTITMDAIQTTPSYDGMLRLSSVTGPDGTVSVGWDSAGRPKGVSRPDGSGTSITYSFTPAVTKEVSWNSWKKTYLDGLGRPVKVETGHGGIAHSQLGGQTTSTPETTLTITETEYAPCACSPFGKATRTSRPRTPSETIAVFTATDYDELGRPTKITHAPKSGTTGDSGNTRFYYDVAGVGPGGVMREMNSVWDPASRWKQSRYDELGNLEQVVEPHPNGTSATWFTNYEYNALGQILTVKMPRDSGITETRRMEYDSAGVLSATVYPENGRTEFGYTGGRLDWKKDNAGKKVSYEYSGPKLMKVHRFNANGTENTDELTTYEYYPSGHLKRLAYRGSAGSVEELYDYTSVGQLSLKRVNSPWSTLDTRWSYTQDGRVETVTYPSGARHKHLYSDDDRDWMVLNPDAPVEGSVPTNPEYQRFQQRYSAGYDNFGRMTGMMEVGWWQNWSFNEGGQMIWYGLHAAGKDVGVSYDYGATPAPGKVMSSKMLATNYGTWSEAAFLAAPPMNYTYDPLGRLASYNGPVTGGQTVTPNYGGWFNPNIPALGTEICTGCDYNQRLRNPGGVAATYDESNQRVLRVKHEVGAGLVPLHEVTIWAGGQRIGV